MVVWIGAGRLPVPQIPFFCRCASGKLILVYRSAIWAVAGRSATLGTKIFYPGNFEQKCKTVLISFQVAPFLTVELPGFLGKTPGRIFPGKKKVNIFIRVNSLCGYGLLFAGKLVFTFKGNLNCSGFFPDRIIQSAGGFLDFDSGEGQFGGPKNLMQIQKHSAKYQSHDQSQAYYNL